MKPFQDLVMQVKNIIDKQFGVMDDSGTVLACSDEGKVGTVNEAVSKVLNIDSDTVTIDGISYQKIYMEDKPKYITFIHSEDAESLKYLSLFSVAVSSIRKYHDEKFSKSYFIKRVISENIFSGDIATIAKELHIQFNANRAVFLVKTEKEKGVYPGEILRSLFPAKSKDFIITIDDENTVLVKELKSSEDYGEIENIARIILDTLNTELMVKAYIGIGSVVESLNELAHSYREAETALSVGRIFESDKFIFSYNKLGLGRLIYQLPVPLCRLFLQEVFKKDSLEILDAETVSTINKFFENNLNISETSRQLYVHRNTLVYRLDKIQKMTGLDLRKFDDAIIFKVSMLVKKYLDNKDEIS